MTAARSNTREWSCLARRFAAVMMLGICIALQILCASHSLHKLLHADAGHANHHCAITAMAHGQIDHTPAESAVVPPNLCEKVITVPVEAALADAPFRLLPSRGPPALA